MEKPKIVTLETARIKRKMELVYGFDRRTMLPAHKVASKIGAASKRRALIRAQGIPENNIITIHGDPDPGA